MAKYSLELAFSTSWLAQSDNLKLLIANQQFGNSEFSEELNENNSSVILRDSKSNFELFESNSIVLYLASSSGTNLFNKLSKEDSVILISLRKHLFELTNKESELDRSSYVIENLPVFKDNEPIITDAFQILVFASLYPFYAAKFKFVNQYKWFSKFFKTASINANVKKLKAHSTAVTSAIAKKSKASKPSVSKAKKETKITRVIDVKQTGEIKLTKYGKSSVLNKSDEMILPVKDKQNILISSALPYVNNVPHLGNIIGSVLSADVFARYVKAKKQYNVLFVGGTDEYGTATETKALEDNTTPQALCDRYYKVHKGVYEWFGIDFDFFGRTTTPLQTEISQDIFMKLWDNEYLSEKTIQQLYCDHHKGFLADRFVNGTCPKCQYPKARGDQCDGCGALLNPLELIDPKCKIDGHSPIARFSDHVYLELDKLEPVTKEWIKKQSEEGYWTKNTKTITNSWLHEGLRPFAITRDLKWGTPVPIEKYSDKVLYVWFDATIGYISITANYFKNKGDTEKWKQWWKTPENNVKLYQFMGKDNVSFHSIIFPASLIGTGDSWVKNHHIDTTEYLQYEGGKFSKSEKIGVFGDQAKDTGIPVSVWRYYLISVRPESSDSQFSWDDLVRLNNTELLANLGNFNNRLIKFVNKNYKSVIPKVDLSKANELIKGYDELIKDINYLLIKYNTSLFNCEERKSLDVAMSISARGNLFLQDNKLDNSLFNDTPEKSDLVVYVGLNLLAIIATVISPFMPETTDKINKQLNIEKQYISDEFEFILDQGHNIAEAEYLFSKIDEKMVEVWRKKYGGKQEFSVDEEKK